ncbi:tetratricopeptide repeat protein [Rhizohabitans arisaemae]|uniref:tetratricopeptide repeat protein n=1 Tax=Rhizohabitans arisaemae TaxID=2720610 RepID=UPI0024B241E3|nr:tetratricopeptide repeat protein [Rhizohabitans arisaemae]
MGGHVLGSGFFAAPCVVVTCAHVVKDRSEVRVVADDGTSGVGRVEIRSALGGQGLWPFPDLAVVRVGPEFEGRPWVLLDDRDPVSGEECHAWGYSRRDGEGAGPGSPASFVFEGVEGDGWLKLKVGAAEPGLSGAPLVSPSRRAVVGVVVASRKPGDDLGGYAAPVAVVRTASDAGPGLADAVSRVYEASRAESLTDRSWQRVLPVEHAGRALDRPWAPFVKTARTDPAELLLAEYGVVPYLFRADALRRVEEWCATADPVSVMLVSAPGGAGKSRFAIEACRRMADQGWLTGLYRGSEDVAGVPLPRLVVVDYAETVSPKQLDELLADFQAHATPYEPVRLLLVTRPNQRQSTDGIGLWRSGLRAARLLVLNATDVNTLAVPRLTLGQRTDLYEEAVKRFAEAWRIPCPQTVPALDGLALPLDVLFEALDQVLNSEGTTSSGTGSPAERVLDHEERYWESWPGRPDIPMDLLRTVVALATLAGAEDVEQAHALLSAHPDLTDDEPLRGRLIAWLSDLHSGDQLVNPLRPDRLGEALISRTLTLVPDGGDTLLSDLLPVLGFTQLTRTLEVLTRISISTTRHDAAITTALATHLADMTDLAEHTATGTFDRTADPALATTLISLLTTRITNHLTSHQPGNTTYRRDLAVSYGRLADLAAAQGQAQVAERLYRDSLSVVERLVAGEPGNTTYQRDLAVSYERLGDLARVQGQVQVAERLYRDSLHIRERLVAGEPGNTTYQRDLVLSYNRLGDLARVQGQVQVAERLYRDSLSVVERLVAGEPGNTTYQRDLAVSYDHLGDLARVQGQVQVAERLYRDSLHIRERLVAGEPGNTTYQRDLAVSYERLGDLAAAEGQVQVAERLYRDSLSVVERLAAGEPGNTTYQRDLAVSYERLGDLAAAEGQVQVAERLYRDLLSVVERLAAGEPGNTTYQRDLAVSYDRLGDLARVQGQVQAAERLYRDSLSVVERLAAGEPGNTTYQRDLAASYERLGDLAAAVEIRYELFAREPNRFDLVEELCVSIYLAARGGLIDAAQAKNEVRRLLAPFAQLGRVSVKGQALLAWADGEA